MRVAVAGGTGVVGRHAVAVLRERGHDVAVLARSTGVDVTTGQGLDAALEGVAAVLDLTSIATTRRRTATGFFTAGTTRLLAAEEQAGVGHHVVLSIVGVDEVDTGYYMGKRRQEELALAGGVPATLLRATQFHEFAGQVLDRFAVGPIAPAPRMRIRPVAAREVAEVLADLATTPAAGRVPDLAGPQIHDLPDLMARVLRARTQRRWLVPVRLPGRAGRAMAEGGLLPGAAARLGTCTFDAWLAETNEIGRKPPSDQLK